MRTTAAVAAVLAVTGAAIGWAPVASAAESATTTECVTQPLGTAGLYAEFVEKNSTRHSDSEGAVAVGGDATFGDPKQPSGFSIGHKLTGADLAKLPGGHSLVVGGTLYANQVVLDNGTGIAGKVVDRSTPGAGFGVDGDKVATGASPVDFGKEFAELRALSTGWAGVKPNGTVSADPSGQGVFLTGTDAKLNVFAVNASDLEKAGAISLKVPAGSSTLVNVLGDSYDMHAKPTYGVWIWDEQANGFVQDDYASGSDAFKQVRSRLLWNFPQAETVKKNYSSWPGTILAPNAAVSMGSATYGPGHVNGSVIAESLDTVPGAETHQMNFTGCLPKETTPGPVVTPEPPTPTETTVPTPSATPDTPEATPSEGGSTPTATATTPGGSASPSTPATPGEATTAPAGTPTPAPSATPEGDLATTGSAIGPGAIGAAVAAVLVGGGFLAFAKRRRRAS
ncbi:choice-of-anchor A family protein [Streptomyces sp. NBC_00250]|uniref:choice-of-anchor A family protein n=1 Tax=Streptomyces sp. NBC_00250 TaxID=2903641 RepID=UPI002E2A94E4|nr:choice-of-anchor A family protein [Streptomyces sp. NBC_00250]